MASWNKVLSKINSIRVYRSWLSVSKVLVMSFPVFPVSSIRRGLSVELSQIIAAFAIFVTKLQAKFPTTAHIALRFISRDAHCGLVFDLSVFPHRKSLRICSFCAPYCAFAGSENMRCAQERLTSPLTPSAYYPNDNSFADINGKNLVFVAAIYNRHLSPIRFLGGVLLR